MTSVEPFDDHSRDGTRLLAGLSDVLDRWDGDYQNLANTVADLVSARVGDRAAVVLLDPPGHERPVRSAARRRRTSVRTLSDVMEDMGDAGLRAWVRDFAETDDRLESTYVPDEAPEEGTPGDEPLYRQLLREHVMKANLAGMINAPLRSRSGRSRGLLICARSVNSLPFSGFERAVLISAADTLGLSLDLFAMQDEVGQISARLRNLESLSESTPDFIGMADNEGRIFYLNSALRNAVSLPADLDISTTTVRDYIDPDDQMIDRPFSEWPQAKAPYWTGTGAVRNWRDGTITPTAASTLWLYDHVTGERIGYASVQRDITAELAAQKAIEDLSEQRRVLLEQLVSAEQAERQRIAQEVHDDAMQLLAAGQLRLQLLANHLDMGNLEASVKAADDITELVSSAQAQLRQLLLDLEPPTAANRQLHEALADTANAFFGDTDTTVTVTGELPGVPEDVASVLYRGAREAISNARRHARASTVELILSMDDSLWKLTILDDGVGLPDELPEVAGHLGLRGMISRARAMGGTCVLRRRDASGGTEVLLSLPRIAGAGEPAEAAGATAPAAAPVNLRTAGGPAAGQ